MPDLRETCARELEELRRRSLLRQCRTLGRAAGAEVELGGRTVLLFGSNDYLGLSRHPKVKEAAREAAAAWGAGSTGSRLTTGTTPLHRELEARLAAFKHTEDAVFFSSGYAAAVGVIPALVGREDLILSDELNHACLIDGCRLSRATVRIYRHGDPDHAAELLRERDRFRRALLVTDGVFSMDGDLAPLPELADLCERADTWLMVDDAHGTGVLGATGTGTVEHFGLQGRVPVQMGTASKALGAEGGFVAGATELAAYVRNRARSFIFSTAPPPATVAAIRAALEVIQEEPEHIAKLHANAGRLRHGLQSLGLRVPNGASPIVPVIVGEAERAVRVSERLLAEGIYIPAIRPPTVPAGSARLRATVTALHTEAQIERAIEAIRQAVSDA